MSTDTNERAAKIRSLNDEFRCSIKGGRVFLTRGVLARGHLFVGAAIAAVREFSDFTEDNDPHGEHDFGAFDLDGERLNWKIDYYATDDVRIKWRENEYTPELEFGSEHPEDPAVTHRVLTILLADEY